MKLLLLAFGPPVANWILSRFWETYREYRLHRLVFWAWFAAVSPAIVVVIFSIDAAYSAGPKTVIYASSVAPVTAVPGNVLRPEQIQPNLGKNFHDFDWVIGKKGAPYPLRLSHYDPVLGGTNCDSDCSIMASGDRVAGWVGGRNGVYAAACPREWGWRIGTRFNVGGNEYECRDTGGWINCYAPGEIDRAIANAHNRGHLLDQPATAQQRYCWVDLMTDPLAPYGALTNNWQMRN